MPHEATPQETIVGLTPVQSAVDAARDAAARAITQVGEAQQLVAMILQGGQPGPLLQALDSIKQVLVLVVQRTGGARQSIEAAIAEARQLGSSGGRRSPMRARQAGAGCLERGFVPRSTRNRPNVWC